MAKVVVRAADNSDLSITKDTILGQFDNLTEDQEFPTFNLVSFNVTEEAENLLEQLRALDCVSSAIWDKEFTTHPVEQGELLHVEHSEGEILLKEDLAPMVSFNENGEEFTTQASKNTRLITSVGASGTIYVAVSSGVFVFSTSSPTGPFSAFSGLSGLVEGATYTFNQTDASNTGYPLRLSTIPDGTFKGGTSFTSGVSITGTPGIDGATSITITTNTPSILYWYSPNLAGMGRYQTSPNRYGRAIVHDYWHLDRISKQNRSYLNRTFNYTHDGTGVDLYVIDSGVRGASRPTGTNAALHPELFDPDFATNLNGTAEQQNYRVYTVAGYTPPYGTNEDADGHGTWCAISAAGRTAGVAPKSRIYALRCFSGGSATLTDIVAAYQAVINHNNSSHPNYKGNTRPAIINASFGPTVPSGSSPYVQINEAGTDPGTEIELFDEIEKTVVDNNIILVRSAGNGFTNSSGNFAGPLSGRLVAGVRGAGYTDSTSGFITEIVVQGEDDENIGMVETNPTFQTNQVIISDTDVNINSIAVGASQYNDQWADFSNYGTGVTTVAPGADLTIPKYDWTTNTSYGTTSNYNTISGTSFSGPIYAGIMCQWLQKNSYTNTTSGLPGLAKNFTRFAGATEIGLSSNTYYNSSSNLAASASNLYPNNSAIEYRLYGDNSYPTFTTTSGSTNLKIRVFATAQAPIFLGNIGKKVQLRINSASLTIGGVDLKSLSESNWFTIASESNTIEGGSWKSITVTLPSAATSTATANAESFLSLIENTHESTDGPLFSNTTLYAETEAQETGHTGTVIPNIPVETGCDFYRRYSSVIYYAGTNPRTFLRGAFTPFIDSNATWANNAGTVGTFANGSFQNINVGLSSLSTFANEPMTLRSYTFTGTSNTTLNGSTITKNGVESGLTFNSSTGYISGTVTSSYQNTLYTFTITENTSGASRSFTFTTTGTGVSVTITQNPTNQSVEAGGGSSAVFGPVAGTVPDGSTIQYEWQVSTDGGTNWTNVPGGTSASLSVSPVYTNNGNRYRCGLYTSTTGGIRTYTTSAVLTVFRVVTVTTQPQNTTVTAPATATFSVVGSTLDSATISYQWQKSEDGITYANIGGATSASYTTAATTRFNDSGDRYRCTLSATGASPVNSNAAQLTVNRNIIISAQPQNATEPIGQVVTFSVTANTSDNDAAAITYQWQQSINGGVSWSNVIDGSGGTTTTYSITASAGLDESRFRCKLNCIGSTGEVITSSATLQVQTPTISITAQPQNATVNEGQTATFTVAGTVSVQQIGANIVSSWDTEQFQTPIVGGTATEEEIKQLEEYFALMGIPSITYQWQRSDDSGANWFNISNATSASYTTPSATFALDNNDLYRCVLSATGAPSVNSNSALLTVRTTLSITGQPSNQTVNEGTQATYSVVATSSSGTPTYQWQRSDDGGANFTSINGATNASYTTPTTSFSADNGDRYRCVVSLVGASGSITSSDALLTVVRVITILNQPQSTSVVEGNTVTLSVGATITSGVLQYQWQISTDAGVNFSDVNGATSNTYTIPPAIFPSVPARRYRVVLSANNATTVTSNVAIITVNESEFVSPPTSVTVTIDPDTLKTYSRRPLVTTAAFVSEYTGSTHFSSYWRIVKTSNNQVVFDTTQLFIDGDIANKTTFTSPEGVLEFDTDYAINVKFRDNNGLMSSYTTPVNFRTPVVDQPEIQTIVPSFNPTVTVLAAQVKAGYAHSSSDWQFSRFSNFSTLVHQSLGNTVNKTSYTLPGSVTLIPNTLYYVRIRFNVISL